MSENRCGGIKWKDVGVCMWERSRCGRIRNAITRLLEGNFAWSTWPYNRKQFVKYWVTDWLTFLAYWYAKIAQINEIMWIIKTLKFVSLFRIINNFWVLATDLSLVGCYNKTMMKPEDRGKIMLLSAKNNLKKMAFFGLTEHQEISQYLFEETFNLKYVLFCWI